MSIFDLKDCRALRGWPLRFSAEGGTNPNRKSTRRGAFSLIELLVAMAVLALLVVLLAQMTSTALSTWNRGEKLLAGGETIRPLEHLITRDFSLMTTQGGLPAFPTNSTRCLPGFFVTASGVTNAARHLTYIEYHWESATARLERRQKPYSWSDAPPPFKHGTNAPTPPPVLSMPPVSGVVAFNLSFLDKDGARQLQYDPETSRLACIALVQADASTVQILAGRGLLNGVITALDLSDPELLGAENPVTLWQQKIESLAGQNKLPSDLVSALRPIQLTLPLAR